MAGLLRALGRAFTGALLSLVHLAAFALSPWRIGRLLRTVSLPRFQEHRLRTALTVLGISLGVAMLIAVVLVNRSILRSFADTLDDISGKADLEVTAAASYEGGENLEGIRAVPGVARATPVVQETALIRLPQAKGERLLIVGVDFLGEDDEHFRRYDSTELKTIKEDPIAFLNASTHVIVSRKLADRFGLKLKDLLPLQTPTGIQQFEIWGFIEDEGVGRAFGGNVAVMYYQAMQVAFERGTRIDRVDIAVTTGHDAATVGGAIAGALGPGFEAGRPERRNAQVAQMLGGLNLALTMGSLVAILVGMFLIYNTMSISVVQRKRELGILRALGTTKRQILVLFTLEGFLLGCVGSALGVRSGPRSGALHARRADGVGERALPAGGRHGGARGSAARHRRFRDGRAGLGRVGLRARARGHAGQRHRDAPHRPLHARRRRVAASPTADAGALALALAAFGARSCRPSPASPMARSPPRRSCSARASRCCSPHDRARARDGPSPPRSRRRSASRRAWPTTTCRGISGARRSRPARSWSASRSPSPSRRSWAASRPRP